MCFQIVLEETFGFYLNLVLVSPCLRLHRKLPFVSTRKNSSYANSLFSNAILLQFLLLSAMAGSIMHLNPRDIESWDIIGRRRRDSFPNTCKYFHIEICMNFLHTHKIRQEYISKAIDTIENM